MTTTSLPQDPTAILTSVEAFFDELPAKRRRKHTPAEIHDKFDNTPEGENYAAADGPAITIELDHAGQVQMFVLLYELSATRGDVMTKVIFEKICNLVGLDADGAAFDDAVTQIRRKDGK